MQDTRMSGWNCFLNKGASALHKESVGWGRGSHAPRHAQGSGAGMCVPGDAAGAAADASSGSRWAEVLMVHFQAGNQFPLLMESSLGKGLHCHMEEQ